MSTASRDLRRFLDGTGLTQERLAWQIGVNQPRISRFLQGQVRPDPDLERTVRAFMADHADCLPGTGRWCETCRAGH